jgi:WD40 repeat protein
MGRFALIASLIAGWAFEAAQADNARRPDPGDRRQRFDAGLILETGGRTGACDVLRFTPDGGHLLAAGDDKVVRSWRFDGTALAEESTASARMLRWSIFREQRGSIYALDLSPDSRQVAIAGVGIQTAALAILDRRDGKVLHAMPTDKLTGVTAIWSLAFAPSGEQVAFGTQEGSVWVWNVRARGPDAVVELGKHAGQRVRLVTYLGPEHLLSVAGDGVVREWRPGPSGIRSTERMRFRYVRKLFAAVLNPQGTWIAAFGESYSKAGLRFVELASLDGTASRLIELETDTHPRCLAFDAKGERLAVGTYTLPAGSAFDNISRGSVALYEVRGRRPQRLADPLPSSYYPEAVAFHPNGRHLAVAGGNDDEVLLWDLARPDEPVSTIVGAGRGLWEVGLSSDGRLLGFRDRREEEPRSPNHRGRGPWKVFDLATRRFVAPGAFKPVGPRETTAGWRVEIDVRHGYRWNVVSPTGRRHELPLNAATDSWPRCYTFLRAQGDKPPRLVVGHYWGMSLFALDEDGPRLERKFAGHQGEVVAVAPSADERLLVTASRDQTLAAWSLEDWPSQPELGARFTVRQGKVLVERVDPGSPAWEVPLSRGDEIKFLKIGAGEFVFDASAASGPRGTPQQCLARLEQPKPGKMMEFAVNHEGAVRKEIGTSVRQRPLWKFFPAASRFGQDWVLWRWRDYYYDTSTRGDHYIGWQVSGAVADTPAFYTAEQFRARFHRPERVSLAVLNQLAAYKDYPQLKEKAIPELEPPDLRIVGCPAEVKDQDPVLTLSATARGEGSLQDLESVTFWINDYRYKRFDLQAGKAHRRFEEKLTVARALLRRGDNVLTLQCVNRAGGRGEKPVMVKCVREQAKPRLHGLFVGIGSYLHAHVPRGVLPELASDHDAENMSQAWQKDTLYRADISTLVNEQAAPERVKQWLRGLRKRVEPDDVCVLYLSGHGLSAGDAEKLARKLFGARAGAVGRLPEGSFALVGPRFDPAKPGDTCLTSNDLYEELVELPCHKVILLDACHSGTSQANPIRELTKEGIGPVIFAACKPEEEAIEHPTIGQGIADSLFTVGIIRAMEDDFALADRDHNGIVDANELEEYVRLQVGVLLDKLRQLGIATATNQQNPDVYLPPLENDLPVARR